MEEMEQRSRHLNMRPTPTMGKNIILCRFTQLGVYLCRRKNSLSVLGEMRQLAVFGDVAADSVAVFTHMAADSFWQTMAADSFWSCGS